MQNNKIENVDKELIKRASEEILKDKRYIVLQEKYKKQMQKKQYVHAMQTKAMMDAQMRDTVQRMIEREVECQKDSDEIIKKLGEESGKKYRDLLNGLCFCIDTIDSILVDINGLMIKGNVNLEVGMLPEFESCKKRVDKILGGEIKKMNEHQLDLYIDEVESLYKLILGRGEAFRVECDKLSTSA